MAAGQLDEILKAIEEVPDEDTLMKDYGKRLEKDILPKLR